MQAPSSTGVRVFVCNTGKDGEQMESSPSRQASIAREATDAHTVSKAFQGSRMERRALSSVVAVTLLLFENGLIL